MISIAIDGPAGAGKSTIAKMVAKDLSYIYVDTGALYRAVGLYMLNHGIDTKNESDVTVALKNIIVEMKHIDKEQRVFLNGEDVSNQIRTESVSMAASNVSAIKSVRAFLLSLQREIAARNHILMDGRDIGTVVLPNATVKIFLTASAEIRAKRRYKELIEKGQKVTYEDVLSDITTRDYNDSNREIAPLRPAEDSKTIDTSSLTLTKSVETVKKVILARIGQVD